MNTFKPIYNISINKDKETFSNKNWTFDIIDEKCPYAGLSANWSDYHPRALYFKDEDGAFRLCYEMKMDSGELFYFFDKHHSIKKNTYATFVDSIKEYAYNSTDISKRKDESSKRITKQQMKGMKISNFVDFGVKFSSCSSIGSGLSRLYRNIILLDIDVDCISNEKNAALLNDLINNKLLNANLLPTFQITNNENGHIQLQWLIKEVPYANMHHQSITEYEKYVANSEEQFYSIPKLETVLNEYGNRYRAATKTLCDLVDDDKFGDKNFTFWKIKNFASAWKNLYNLSLDIPYNNNGVVEYLTEDKIDKILNDKKQRALLYSKCITLDEFINRLNTISNVPVEEYLGGHSDCLIEEVEIAYEESTNIRVYSDKESSRNQFVFRNTRNITWQILNKRKLFDIKNKSASFIDKLRKELQDIVWAEFQKKDKYYNSKWPGTTHKEPYLRTEFKSTFNGAFKWAIAKYVPCTNRYSQTKLELSKISRETRKYLELIVTEYMINKYQKMKWKDLTTLINENLPKSISTSSVRRLARDIKSMNNDEKYRTYQAYYRELDDRRGQYEISVLSKRLKKESKENYLNRYNAIYSPIVDIIRDDILKT